MISPRSFPVASPPEDPPPAAWPAYALSARVVEALELSLAALDRLTPSIASFDASPPIAPLRDIALLVRAVLTLDAERYPALAAQGAEVANALARVARAPAMARRLAWAPADARDTAFAHVVLTASGHPDARFHARLDRALAAPTSSSGERLPHERLRHAWLALLDDTAIDALDTMADRTAVASPIDLCSAGPHDLFAVADALRWVTDLGRRMPRLARAARALLDELDSALALALDADDVALVAELLLAWPVLHAAWSPTASFAYAWVVAQEPVRRVSLEASCALGTLSAVALRGPWRPLCTWDSDAVRAPLWHMLRGRLDATPSPSWLVQLDAAPWEQQRGVSTLLLDAALRRAIDAHDLVGVRELLVAVEACGARGTALCVQAAALLARVDGDALVPATA
ncbi:MAG: hypothetical protein MUF00_05450 [Gemmatimonadaceae bacterium]|jgi:hypothetical protein|nr:hypothetical protein [Gemmatimonadaceae bacterium]